jgi:hypothetical protein
MTEHDAPTPDRNPAGSLNDTLRRIDEAVKRSAEGVERVQISLAKLKAAYGK